MRLKNMILIAPVIILLSCSGASDNTAKGRADGGKNISGEDEPSGKKIRKAGSQKKIAKFPSLNIDFLFNKKTAEGDAGSQRNIVAMEEDPVVVAERKKREEEARKQAEEAAKKAEEARIKQQEETAKNPPPPEPPPIPFDFVGYMGPAGDHIGVFRIGGKDDDLILSKKGDKIQEEFKIVEIGYESAEIGFDGFTETKTIPLVAGGK
jgi:hypothetical protein